MGEASDIFQRTELLLGAEAMAAISSKMVILFGVGGVGSWCAEGLVRSGVRDLTIVDPDRVAPSNVNRQLMATSRTIGRVKVEALRERLLEINPEARITALPQMFTEGTAASFDLDGYDYVIDAIDSLKDKVLLILQACRSRAVLFSSMGAALKKDPSRIRVSSFWEVDGDPLARALRKKIRRGGTLPEKDFLCVWSDELFENKGDAPGEEAALFNKACTNGTLAHITAIFGFTLSSLVINDVLRQLPV